MMPVPSRPNYRRPLWNALANDQQAILARAADAATQAGGAAYLVGGPVRDLLRGDPRLRDIDITTTVDARTVAEAFARATGAKIVQRTDFGTATVRLPTALAASGAEIDVATTRTETYAAPGALPTVIFPVSIEDDLRRRDFTTNAMALPLTPDGFGALVAVPHARADLRDGRIRVLHVASFRDDPTRLFRAVRYTARYGFALEPQTADLFAAAMAAHALAALSAARKRHEIELGMLEADGIGCLAAFASHGLLAMTSPALVWDAWVAEKLRHILPLVQARRRDVPEHVARETRVITALWPAWACFVCRQGEGAVAHLFADLGPFTARMERDIRHLVRLWQARDAITPQTPLSTIAKLAVGLPQEITLALFAGEPQADRLAAYYRRVTEIEAENTRAHHFEGNDLGSLNLPKDARRRRVLDALKDARLDGAVATYADEFAFVERYIKEHDPRARRDNCRERSSREG
jgi:tRNA nucleotidyltransferase (CCA-adding enzyme)